MNRILIFHYPGYVGSIVRMQPSAYYIDADYEKVAVRIYAENAPLREARIDIYDDGTSIFNTHSEGTYVTLAEEENAEEAAESFNDDILAEGSWVYCNLVDTGGGSNFTVQLELKQI